MALPDLPGGLHLPGGLPGNLSRSAVDDLIRLLRRSAREFGVVVSRRSRARLLRQIEAIRDGKAIGYRRPDVQPRRPTQFLNEDPWVLCFNPDTRQVYRILHGARDFLFGGSIADSGTRDDDTT